MVTGSLLQQIDLERLGSHLKTVREFKGLSRAEAARKADVSVSWLEKMENARNFSGIPNPAQLLKYSEFLGIKLDVKYTVK